MCMAARKHCPGTGYSGSVTSLHVAVRDLVYTEPARHLD
ncbi:hypothetical protein DE4587_00813 [Mycobacteroides salmoniphilum]|nr:hypothetical protein DE4586_00897 [Mycobacteroides salmoniphilum]TDZ88453.1 hypothetical protein DE4587_00813 [Mycobacteroides salmoniphilum]